MDSATAKAALDSFQTVDSATALGQAQQKYGVDALQKKVADYRGLTSNLTSAIAAVDPSVTGRTAGTLTTEGQRSALVNRERAPVIGQLGTAQTGLGQAADDFKTTDSKARNEADAVVNDNKTKHDRLVETYTLANAREEAARQAATQAESQRQAQANADRQFAEGQRQYNESEATARGAARYSGGGGSGGGKASEANTKAAVQQHVTQQLASSTGRDGHVSNETFAAALNDFQAVGGTVRQFWQQFGRYTNPKYVSSYAGYHQR